MWHYRLGRITCHEDLYDNCTDIVYRIDYTNGQSYFGKKAVRAKRKYPPLKGKKRCRRLMKDLPFIDYEGSHKSAKDLVVSEKTILYQCSSRKASTYMEMACIVTNHAIFLDKYLNDHTGTFFTNSLDGLITPL